MTTPCTGPISLLDVRNEVKSTGAISLGDAKVRTLAGIAAPTAISLFELYCLPKAIPLSIHVGSIKNLIVNPGFVPHEREVSGEWTVSFTGFGSATPTMAVINFQIDVGSPGHLPIHLAVSGNKIIMRKQFITFSSSNHFSMRIFVKAFKGADSAYDVGYFSYTAP